MFISKPRFFGSSPANPTGAKCALPAKIVWYPSLPRSEGSNPVTGRVLPRHDGCSRRRANRLGVKLGEPNPLLGQPFHIRGAIPIVKRMTFWVTVLIGQHRDGGVHQAHVINKEKDDVGRCPGRRDGADQKQGQQDKVIWFSHGKSG